MPTLYIAHQDFISVFLYLNDYVDIIREVERDPLQIMLYLAVTVLSEQVRNTGHLSELDKAGSCACILAS